MYIHSVGGAIWGSCWLKHHQQIETCWFCCAQSLSMLHLPSQNWVTFFIATWLQPQLQHRWEHHLSAGKITCQLPNKSKVSWLFVEG